MDTEAGTDMKSPLNLQPIFPQFCSNENKLGKLIVWTFCYMLVSTHAYVCIECLTAKCA